MTKKEIARRNQYLVCIEEYAKGSKMRKDRYGNLVNPTKTVRIKFKANVLRLERKVAGKWTRVYSLFYKDLNDRTYSTLLYFLREQLNIIEEKQRRIYYDTSLLRSQKTTNIFKS